jgi:hypothetical protein
MKKILDQSQNDIFAMSYNRSLTRNFKVTIKLTSVADASDLYPETHFEYQRKKSSENEDEYYIISCRFINYLNVKPAELGQLTRVTVKTNDFQVSPDEIVPWLAKFGSVSKTFDFERNSLGIRTDIFETEILLKKHIPEYLPIAGRKLLVSYPGIPKACNNCYNTGHMKRNCKEKKRKWVHRVAELRASGDFEDELFGG